MAALAVVVAGPLLAWVLLSTVGAPPDAEARPVERVSANEAGGLTVFWSSDGCDRVDPGSSDVVADAMDVVVTVRAVPVEDPAACEDDVEVRSWTIALAEPLGDRTVRDGACLTPRLRATAERCADGAPSVPVVGPEGR